MKTWYKKAPIIIVTLLAVTLLMLAAGTRFGRSLFASHEGFYPIETDARVYAENEDSGHAAYIASVLETTAAEVERQLGRPFRDPIKIYVCGSQDRFNRHVPIGLNASGAVFMNRLYISPRAFELASAQPILMHELVHLHLRQQMGTMSFQSKLPGWFQEGLAVSVSDGGGAVQVDAPSAREAILTGNTFAPEDEGSWVRPKMAGDHRMQHHMFYRQSGMYVDFLREKDPEAFRQFLGALMDGEEFAVAFEILGGSVTEMWDLFVRQLDSTTREF